MMFIIRTEGETPAGSGFTIRLARRTPPVVSGGVRDFFCDGDPEAARRQGLNVVAVHDGWYADDSGGGVAVWGQGEFWEIRDTPFTVRETAQSVAANTGASADLVDVRQAIFGV